MNNAYKSVVVEMDTADQQYTLLTATAGSTLVKQVAYFHKDHNSIATLYIQKKGGSVVEINQVTAVAATSTNLNTDIIALEVGDKILVSADHISSTDFGYSSVMYVESTNMPSYPSILSLADVDGSPTDKYVLSWDDATQSAVWVPATLSDTNIVLPDGTSTSTTGVAPLTFYYLKIPDVTQWTVNAGLVAVSIQYVLPPHTITFSNITTGYRLIGEVVVEVDSDSEGMVAAEAIYSDGILGSSIARVEKGVSTISVKCDQMLIKETEVVKFRVLSLGPPIASAKLKSVNLTVRT